MTKIQFEPFRPHTRGEDYDADVLCDGERCGNIQALVRDFGVSRKAYAVFEYTVTLTHGPTLDFPVLDATGSPVRTRPTRGAVRAALGRARAWIRAQLAGGLVPGGRP